MRHNGRTFLFGTLYFQGSNFGKRKILKKNWQSICLGIAIINYYYNRLYKIEPNFAIIEIYRFYGPSEHNGNISSYRYMHNSGGCHKTTHHCQLSIRHHTYTR